MEEIINKLLDIDNKAKSIMLEYQEKKNNLDVYISEEIAKRKKEIDSQYKFRIDFHKDEYIRKLNEKKNIMNEIKDKGIEELKESYNIEKNRLAEDIIKMIIYQGG